jgi:hypothetical protein
VIDQAGGIAWIVLRALATLSPAVNGTKILWGSMCWCARMIADGLAWLKHRLLIWAGLAIVLYVFRSLRKVAGDTEAVVAFALLAMFALAALSAQQQRKSLSEIFGRPPTPLGA